MQSACAGNTNPWRVGRQFCGLQRELYDRDRRNDDQDWIDYQLEQVATLFFRTHQKRIGRFMLVLWFIGWVCYCFHEGNLKRRRLAAMTMIIKFLPLVPISHRNPAIQNWNL